MKKIKFLIILIMLVMIGCSKKVSSNNIPIEAKNIIDIGNGWVIFELNENKFLFYRETNGHKGFTAITQIKED